MDVHVVGSQDTTLAGTLRWAALGVASPPTRVDPIDPAVQPERANAYGHADGKATTAYACQGTSCFARATSAAELLSALRSL